MHAGGEAEEGLEGRHRCPPTVETKGELVEVGLEVVVPDAVMGTAEPGLEVSKDAMDMWEQFSGPLGRALSARAVTIAQGGEGGVALPRIRQDEGAGGDGALHEADQRTPGGIWDDLKPDAA